jgi:hypothetical protein
VEPMKQRPRLRLVTSCSRQWSAEFAAPAAAPDTGCRDPAVTACGGLDLHADIGGPRSPWTRTYSFQLTFAKDRVGSKAPLVDHRTHACSSRRGTAHGHWGGDRRLQRRHRGQRLRADRQGPLWNRSSVILDKIFLSGKSSSRPLRNAGTDTAQCAGAAGSATQTRSRRSR